VRWSGRFGRECVGALVQPVDVPLGVGERGLLLAGVEVVPGVGRDVGPFDVERLLQHGIQPEDAARAPLEDRHAVALEADEVRGPAVPLDGGEGTADQRQQDQAEQQDAPGEPPALWSRERRLAATGAVVAAVRRLRRVECDASSGAPVLALDHAGRFGAAGEPGCRSDREGAGRRPGAPPVVDDVDDDDRHVVATAPVDRPVHELLRGLGGILHLTEQRRDARLRDLVEQAVGAQQVAIAHHGVDGEGVDRHPVVDAERARDDVALRVDRGLLRRQGPLPHQVGHQAVVVGELLELPDRVAIDPRVAHVGDRQDLFAVFVDHGQRHHRGAHAGEFRVGGGGLVDGLVGPLDGVDQPVDGAVGEAASEGLAGDRRRHVTAAVAAHAVGDGPQADVVAGHVVVVVRGAHAPDVCGASPAQGRPACHRGHRWPLTSAPGPCCRSGGGRGA
jgi:hypothetical protein